MFTGLITAVGTIKSVAKSADGLVLALASPFADIQLGESVAVDGACLTVQRKGNGWFEVQVIDTSLDRTRFGDYQVGERVNLERALRVGDRLGGHMVQGHVDGVGLVRQVTNRKDARVIDLDVPAQVSRVSVPLGSITVDGVSLTVVQKLGPRTIRISLIPFTLQETTLSRLEPGARVHVEGDILGKYVESLLAPRTRRRPNRKPRSGRGKGSLRSTQGR